MKRFAAAAKTVRRLDGAVYFFGLSITSFESPLPLIVAPVDLTVTVHGPGPSEVVVPAWMLR
jgi:hypothetical protein